MTTPYGPSTLAASHVPSQVSAMNTVSCGLTCSSSPRNSTRTRCSVGRPWASCPDDLFPEVLLLTRFRRLGKPLTIKLQQFHMQPCLRTLGPLEESREKANSLVELLRRTRIRDEKPIELSFCGPALHRAASSLG